MKFFFILTSIFLLISCGNGSSSHSENVVQAERWSIPSDQVIDAGPGKNGIPALSFPDFIPVNEASFPDEQLILGVKQQGIVKAYPHNILDWHEIVNDRFNDDVLILSYCPLTGTGMLWESNSAEDNPTWGVSGLLYNSNLILYDRDTDSNWSQMLEQSVQGSRVDEIPVKLKTIEMTWESWKKMYPDSLVLSTDTGYVRDYSNYPYRGFRLNKDILFPVSSIDDRLHPKERVVGIRDATGSKVFQIDSFDAGIQVINTEFNGQPIVVIGSSDMRFAAIYSGRTSDGITQVFTAVQDQLPIIMTDQEGNSWDIFGNAVAGDRSGQELAKTESYIAYWYAWAAFFPNAEIYF